jgi:Fe2+ transport system protein FeoA
MTLDKAKSNQTVEISQIAGGCVRQRLNELGLFVGAHIKIKQGSSFGGPIVIAYNNSEIAIGRGMASHIQIKPDDRNKS